MADRAAHLLSCLGQRSIRVPLALDEILAR